MAWGYETSHSDGRYRVYATVTFDLDFFIARCEGKLPDIVVDDPESSDMLMDTVLDMLRRELNANGMFSAEYSIEVEDYEPEDELEEEVE